VAIISFSAQPRVAQTGGQIASSELVGLAKHIHIFGAAGSGTTTLAAALSTKSGHQHFDSDEFYWMPTDPPYQQSRPRSERYTLLANAVAQADSWVISGSLCGWGDPFISQFELVVFLLVPAEERIARLRAREIMRYGHEAIAPGGRLYKTHVEFLKWAQRYDVGDMNMRSRALHEWWIQKFSMPVLRLDENKPVNTLLEEIEARASV
jgi:adenylate kinase family enzyme